MSDRRQHPASLADLIGSGGGALGRLAREARQRTELTQNVRRRLPDALAAEVRHVSAGDGGEAVITVRSAAVASRLHFEQARLLEALAAEGVAAERVRVKVAPG